MYKNKAKSRASQRKWRKANRDKVRGYQARYRAKLAAAQATNPEVIIDLSNVPAAEEPKKKAKKAAKLAELSGANDVLKSLRVAQQGAAMKKAKVWIKKLEESAPTYVVVEKVVEAPKAESPAWSVSELRLAAHNLVVQFHTVREELSKLISMTEDVRWNIANPPKTEGECK